MILAQQYHSYGEKKGIIMGSNISNIQKKSDGRRNTFKIVSFYILIAGLWILLSDHILFIFIKDTETLTRLQTFKDLFFSIIMAGMLYILIQRNNNNRDQMEEALRDSDTRYRKLIKLSPEPIFVHENDIIVYVNKAFLTLIGASHQDEILGQSIINRIYPDFHKVVNERIRSVSQSDRELDFIELKLIKLDGTIIDVEASSIYIYKHTGIPVIQSVYRDITKRKQTEESIRKSEKLSVVGQLAAGVAHEIRNPLTSLKGFLQLLNSRNLDYKDYFDIMLTEVDRINFIVNEFMVVANPHVDRLQEEKNLQSILHSIVLLLDTQAILINVQIVTEYDIDLPLIKCDENQLKQVFINILKNALEAMQNGGVILIQVKNLKPDKILIRFIDQGTGIPEERISKLGEPFYTTKETGTGLGLMVTYKIIEAHKGHIYIKSKINHGTTVDIILPNSH